MFETVTKLGLITFIGSFLSLSLYAAEPEITVSGDVSASIAQTSEKTASDSYSYIDMDSGATVAVEASIEAGEWKTTGAADFELTADGMTPLNRTISLERKSLSIAIGSWEFDADDITIGKKYLDSVDESLSAGVNAFEDGGGDYLKVGLADAGIQFTAGVNSIDDGGAGEYSETALSVSFGETFGDISVSASIISVSEKVDEKRYTAGVDGDHDGKSKSETAAAIGYNVGEINFSLNIDQYTVKRGDSAVDDEKQMTAELVFDLGLGNDSGVTLSYGTVALDDGTDEKTMTTAINLGYLKPFAGAVFSIGYSSTSTMDDDTGQEDTTSILGAGLTYEF